ncbi:MAG TPA: hypothetical protein VL860_08415, partial [Planctomycetota bacterium]|nr:hypothetical protein [Planctomycetota bacterium]
MTLSIEQELLTEIVDRFRQRICVGDGEKINRKLYFREAGRTGLPKWCGFAAGAAAYLALARRPDNPWHGRDDLLQFAFDAGDRLLIDHADVGRTQVKPNHFTIFPLTSLYELAAVHAGAKRRAQWRELMVRNLKQVDRLIDRTWATLGKPGPYAGTGPNHIFGWLAVGYGQAKALHDAPRMRRYEKAFLKHLTIQAPG